MAQSTNSRQVVRLSDTVLPFGKYKHETFDQTPLSYLDWLSGQNWLYGDLRKRLTKYMTHPVIQRELDLEFPDKELESSAFTVMSTYGDRTKNAWADYGSKPKPEEPRDWQPERFGTQKAWTKALDLLERFEHSRTNEELDEHARQVTPALKRFLPCDVVQELRTAYKQARERIQLDNRFTPQQWAEANDALEALDRLDQDERKDFSAEEALESLQCRRPDLIDAMKQLL